MRKVLILVTLAVFACSFPAHAKKKVDPKLYGSPEGQVCIKCHELKSPGLFKMWRSGRMGQAGVNCYDCHRAEKKSAKKPAGQLASIIAAANEKVTEVHEAEHQWRLDLLKENENFSRETVDTEVEIRRLQNEQETLSSRLKELSARDSWR